MFYEIRRLFRGALLAAAIATGTAMLSATPSQAIPDDEGCLTITALDMATGEHVECYYCEIRESGHCRFTCENGSAGGFPCEGDFA